MISEVSTKQTLQNIYKTLKISRLQTEGRQTSKWKYLYTRAILSVAAFVHNLNSPNDPSSTQTGSTSTKKKCVWQPCCVRYAGVTGPGKKPTPSGWNKLRAAHYPTNNINAILEGFFGLKKTKPPTWRRAPNVKNPFSSLESKRLKNDARFTQWRPATTCCAAIADEGFAMSICEASFRSVAERSRGFEGCVCVVRCVCSVGRAHRGFGCMCVCWNLHAKDMWDKNGGRIDGLFRLSEWVFRTCCYGENRSWLIVV